MNTQNYSQPVCRGLLPGDVVFDTEEVYDVLMVNDCRALLQPRGKDRQEVKTRFGKTVTFWRRRPPVSVSPNSEFYPPARVERKT